MSDKNEEEKEVNEPIETSPQKTEKSEKAKKMAKNYNSKSDKGTFLALEKALSKQVKAQAKEIDKLYKEISELKKENEECKKNDEELTKKNLIAHADLENTRKRLIKDKEEAIIFANSKLVEELLIPLDNLDRAIVSAETAKDVKTLIDGVSMVKSQLFSTLEKYGLTEINSVGKEFDPQLHEACMMEEDEKVKIETVQQEFSKGYKLHDRVLRPAKVKVIKPKV